MEPPDRVESRRDGYAPAEGRGERPNLQKETPEIDNADGVDPAALHAREPVDRAAMDVERRERNAFETYLDARYLSEAREIRTAKADLESLLKNSRKLRLGWLKLTGQISKDPDYDLHTLNGLAEMKESYAAEERRSFEIERAQRRAQDAALEQTRMNEAGLRRTMSAHEAKALVELMDDANVKPVPELYRRAGQGAPSRRVAEVTIPGFVNDNLANDVAPSAMDEEFGVDFDPPY